MLLCVRTTIELNDELLRAAKSHAAREGQSLKATIERALRELLAGAGRADGKGPPLPVFRGQGMQPGVDLTDNAALEDLLNAKP